MDSIFEQGGVRFLVGVPHPAVGTEGFVDAVLRTPEVRRALTGPRSRLLHTTAVPVLDKEGDRDYYGETEAVFYDYAHNRTVTVTGQPGGRPPFRIEYSNHQPVPSPDEFTDAVALVAASPGWGPLLQAGHVVPYPPMPPVLEPVGNEPVERTLYVGLFSRERVFHRIVAVNMVRRTVSREAVRPRAATVRDLTCGAAGGDCVPVFRRGSSAALTIEWPHPDPVWSFQAIRPSASSGTSGSGIEIRNVKYRGRRVLKQGHVPILNVKYDDDFCGPYRDWLWQETCFQAVGTDIVGAPGFRMCTEPPQTIYNSGVDEGDFTGVAVWVDGEGALRLTTQCSAGWYRYMPEWQFRLDGTLVPQFYYGSTDSFCTCAAHHHHAYWRLDFDILHPHNRVEAFDGTAWQPIKHETSAVRPADGSLLWRVMASARPDVGYLITPGQFDGSASDFSGPDQFVLRHRPGQVDDSPMSTVDNAQANLQQFVNHQPVWNQDIVVWYSAHFDHLADDQDVHPYPVGPTLTPINWPTRKP